MLDEIGEMPVDMQTKLLRVLQEGVIMRIGSQKPIPVDVRVIAVSNRDLKQEVEMGRFRKDLFYRLNVLPLYLPPLRERKGDVILLIEYFMKNISKRLNKKEIELPDEYLQKMLDYNWPGNIRELENLIELIINTETLPSDCFGQDSPSKDSGLNSLAINHVEREHLITVLKKYNGNITQSALALGIRRNTLYNKIRKYEIRV